MGAAYYNFDDDPPRQKAKSKKAIPASSKPTRRVGNMEKDVLRHQHPTFLTPTVNRVAKNLFEVSLEVAKSKLEDDDSEQPRPPHYKGHYSDPQSITWGDEMIEGSKIFGSAIVDDVVYNVSSSLSKFVSLLLITNHQAGDIIMVEPDVSFEDASHNPNAFKTANKYGNHWW